MLLLSKKFREKFNTAQKMIGLGQALLVFGLVLLALGVLTMNIIDGNLMTDYFNAENWDTRLNNFLSGLSLGLGSVLMGLSIVLNVQGIKMYKKK